MLYALICIDKADSAELRTSVRGEHLKYIEAQAGAVKIAGPFLSDDGMRMTGSLIILEASDLAGAKLFAEKDPYAQAGLFDRVDIRPWRWVVGATRE